MLRLFANKFTALILIAFSFTLITSSKNKDSLYDINDYIQLSLSNFPAKIADFTAERNTIVIYEEVSDIVIVDNGLNNVLMFFQVPNVLPVDETLTSSVKLVNNNPGLKCLYKLYINDELVLEEVIMTCEEFPTVSRSFEYARIMDESVDLKASLSYLTENGDMHVIEAHKIVKIENRHKSHWMELEAERVLEMVSSVYNGDFTLEWALENDYDDFDKEVFVNMMGYESRTDYLLWVNRSHQRVNVFEGSAGSWELTHSFLAGTGMPGRGTKRGVTYISEKSAQGWHFGSYRVLPVLRFWPGTGFAFHSRILHPRTLEVTDESIGFPVSMGCVRMYCDDIWFLYNNIPMRTTVVIH